MLTMGSLFSGIGGLELGLEWAGLGPTLWQVENAENLHPCLAEHWPNAKRFHDVREVGAATLDPVDLICGGFPCQDVSSAGKRAGLAGARSGLWYEFARIVGELRPQFVVVENVASGATKWVEAVRGDLERRGYATLPVPVASRDLGAPYRRSRIFIVGRLANSHDTDVHARSEQQGRPSTRQRTSIAHGSGLRLESGRSGGAHGTATAELARSAATDADDEGQLQPRRREPDIGGWTCDAPWIWTAEPDVARVVSRLPARVDRERALANCVSPQVAEVIGWLIVELAGSGSSPTGKEK